MDQASHLSVGSPQHDKFTRDIEDGIALGQGYSKSDFPPLSDQSSSSASFSGSSTHTQSLFSAVNSTLVPPPADTDELYPSLSTSTSFSSDISNDNHNNQDAANTTLDCEVAFADLCKEIGASLSSFDLAQQLESAGNSVESGLLLNSASFGADSEGFDQSNVVSASTSAVELREAILTGSDSSTLNDRPSPIFPSLFISPPAYFDDQYDTLMTYHRRRLEIHFNISVHLVGLEGDRRLICHRMHSCKTYRTEAIGMTGQVLSESLKDAARVVGNCYPEAQQNGATFEVGVRIATVTTRHHFDSNMDEWVSLGWESCKLSKFIFAFDARLSGLLGECAFQLIVALDDSIPPPSPNPINNSNFPTHSPSFWARLWMYQLWDGPGDLFGPRPGGPNRYGNLIYAHM
ncbi:hypothetical protein B0J17DRAFT_724364 [Rhizoctonia solani]|nr:hypothetical protein B0J17DRAFT_724364 [Rhizoctonia solani]